MQVGKIYQNIGYVLFISKTNNKREEDLAYR